MSNWTLSTAPTAEPVTLAELKANCRIDVTDHDDLLTSLLLTAREYLEEVTWRSFITQTWVLRTNAFSDPIYLPRPPLASITSIKYYDTGGTEQTLSTDVYEAGIYDDIGVARLKYLQCWPACRGHEDDITITYVAGYGATASTVPQPLRHAILLLAGHLFDHPEIVATGVSMATVPMSVSSLLAPYTISREDYF
jgi:uncharacterized phiE125 gp8 family phage protein